MSTNFICFYGEIRKIIPEISLNTDSPEHFLCIIYYFFLCAHKNVFFWTLIRTTLLNTHNIFFLFLYKNVYCGYS